MGVYDYIVLKWSGLMLNHSISLIDRFEFHGAIPQGLVML